MERRRSKPEDTKPGLRVQRDVDEPPGKGVGHGIVLSRNVEDAKIDRTRDECRAAEQENRVVGNGCLQGIEHLDGIEIVSEDRQAARRRIKGSGEFDGRGDSESLQPKDCLSTHWWMR